MALAEVVAAPAGTDLAEYSEPRLSGAEWALLDAVRWAHGKTGKAPTVARVAMEAQRGATDEFLLALYALECAGLVELAGRRVALTIAGRGGLALADMGPVECPRCGTGVLVVDVGGHAQALEPGELLPAFPCPLLAASRWTLPDGRAMVGAHSGHCVRCGGSGVVGEPLPARGVAVDGRGRARRFQRVRGRVYGEAVYAPHVC